MPLHGEKTWRVTEYSSMLRGSFPIHLVEQKKHEKVESQNKNHNFLLDRRALFMYHLDTKLK